MKKWMILAPLGLAAAGAALLLLKKKPAEKAASAKTVPVKKPAPAKAPANLKTGSYSFISGFQNASTVEMTLSSDSHVAILEGEDFSLQLEYAAFYPGEDFAAHCASLAEKHQDFAPVRYGSVDAVKYLEGDALSFCLPIPEDAHSYVQVLLFKAKGNDTPLPELAEAPDLSAILSSVRFHRT